MKQLNNTIHRLTTSPNKSVTVTNLDTGDKIVCNKKGSLLIEQYGSIEAFFDSIYKSGVTKIRVSDRNPSGTSSTPDGEPYNVSLVPGSESTAEVKTETAVQDNKPKPPIMPGLNGDFGAIGLNAAQMDIAGKMFDYPRVVAELERYKSKSERLETEVQDLKTKILINDTLEGKSVAKTEANTKLMEQFAPLLGALGQKFLAPAAPVAEAAGLAGTANLSAIKQRVVSLVSNEDDSVVFYIGKLMEKLSDDTVWNDFEEILKKNNLLPTS